MFAVTGLFFPEPLSHDPPGSMSPWDLMNSVGIPGIVTNELADKRFQLQILVRKVNSGLGNMFGSNWPNFSFTTPDPGMFAEVNKVYQLAKTYTKTFKEVVVDAIHGSKPIYLPFTPSYKWASYEPLGVADLLAIMNHSYDIKESPHHRTHCPYRTTMRYAAPVISEAGPWFELTMLENVMVMCCYLKAMFATSEEYKEFLIMASEGIKCIKKYLSETYRSHLVFAFYDREFKLFSIPRDLQEHWWVVRATAMSTTARYRKMQSIRSTCSDLTTKINEASKQVSNSTADPETIQELINSVINIGNQQNIPIVKQFHTLSTLYTGMRNKLLEIANDIELGIPRTKPKTKSRTDCDMFAQSFRRQAKEDSYKAWLYTGIGIYMAYKIHGLTRASGNDMQIDPEQMIAAPSRSLALMSLIVQTKKDSNSKSIPQQEVPPNAETIKLANTYIPLIMQCNVYPNTVVASTISDIKSLGLL